MDRVDDPNHVHEPVADNVRDVTEGVSRLVREHIELARSELTANLKKVAFDASLTGAGGGLLLLGWLLLMFSAGYGLGTILGDGYAFLIIAGAHIVIGFALVAVFGSRLRTSDKVAPDQTRRELVRDRQFLHRVRAMVQANRQLPA